MAVPLPRPRSEAQRAAARRNGARSRGPVSEAGKARASRNALRHGLCATTHLVAQGEDPTELEALLAELRAEHRPRTPSEDVLVHRLAVVVWKLARCDRLEAALMDSRPRPPAGRVYAEPGLPAFLSRPAELGALLRHQAQLHRELHRLLRTLADRPRRARGPRPEAEPAAFAAPGPAHAAAAAGPRRAPASPGLRNEPEPARPAAAPPEAAPPADSAAAERALLGRAAARPELARTLVEHLLEEGELARLARLAARLGPVVPPAAVDGRRRVG